MGGGSAPEIGRYSPRQEPQPHGWPWGMLHGLDVPWDSVWDVPKVPSFAWWGDEEHSAGRKAGG